jgi:hypothetical protein
LRFRDRLRGLERAVGVFAIRARLFVPGVEHVANPVELIIQGIRPLVEVREIDRRLGPQRG